jgi:GT2 family glycosyltransferase
MKNGSADLFCWIPRGSKSLHLVDSEGEAYNGNDVSIYSIRKAYRAELAFRVAFRSPKKFISICKLIFGRNGKGAAFRFARVVDELNSLPYAKWLSMHKGATSAASNRSTDLTASVLVTIQPGPASKIEATERSLHRQSVDHWKIVDRAALKVSAGRPEKLLWLSLPAGAVLAEGAIQQLIQSFTAPQVAAVYCDEDQIDSRGRRHRPFLKPAWSPLLADSGWLPLEGAVVRLSAVPDNVDLMSATVSEVVREIALSEQKTILHLPLVLLSVPAKRIVETPSVPKSIGSSTCSGKVTVIIPTRDRMDLLSACLGGLQDRTTGVSLDVIIIDNDSEEEDTRAYLREVERRGFARVVPMPGSFNFSRACNLGVSEARSELVLLLNNDVDPIGSDWLFQMCLELQDPTVGAVGAYLLYPDGLVQHAGVTLGAGSVARHSFAFIDPSSGEDRGLLQQRRDVSAVTAACLLTTKSHWRAVNGMDEQSLAVAFNDVDYCLKLRQMNKRIIWTPHAKLWHRESVSRGRDNTAAKLMRFAGEEATMHGRWGKHLLSDPFHNPNLSLVAEDFVLEAFPSDLAARTSKWR